MKKIGLIGKSLGHSFSKTYFTKKFEKEEIQNFEYLNFELPEINYVENLIEDSSLNGFNVTIPYKEEIIPFLDELSEEARAIEAVNTVRIHRHSDNIKLVGHNTDAFGFYQSIKPFFSEVHKKSLVFGTGGASKAIVFVLEKLGVDVLLVSRSPKSENEIHYENLSESFIKEHKLLVNTTPLGTYPNIDDCIDIPFNGLTEHHLVVDLIYNPLETRFLRKSKSKGAITLNGMKMLEEQAEKAWEIFSSND